MTSGGDAPGMNAAVRGVVRTAIISWHWKLTAFTMATKALLKTNIEKLDRSSVSDVNRGGTF
ncbi:6-phosphofructokinase [Vibrio lentus]|nr:6-phosphofructokinase [Vibrio lentus]